MDSDEARELLELYHQRYVRPLGDYSRRGWIADGVFEPWERLRWTLVMLEALPGWVIDNASSSRARPPYVALDPDERARLLVKLCGAAMSIARGRADSAAVFAYRDRMPASTEQALERLCALARAK